MCGEVYWRVRMEQKIFAYYEKNEIESCQLYVTQVPYL